MILHSWNFAYPLGKNYVRGGALSIMDLMILTFLDCETGFWRKALFGSKSCMDYDCKCGALCDLNGFFRTFNGIKLAVDCRSPAVFRGDSQERVGCHGDFFRLRAW